MLFHRFIFSFELKFLARAPHNDEPSAPVYSFSYMSGHSLKESHVPKTKRANGSKKTSQIGDSDPPKTYVNSKRPW